MIDVRPRIDDELEFIDLKGLMSTHGTKQLKDVFETGFQSDQDVINSYPYKITLMSLIRLKHINLTITPFSLPYIEIRLFSCNFSLQIKPVLFAT